MSVISMQGVSRRFGDHWAVRSLDLEIADGEAFVIVGTSGSGKTTTLRMINRLIEPTEGTIRVLDEEVQRTDPAVLRRRIGYVIQGIGLFPHYTVARNAAVVPELLGWTPDRIRARVDELLELMGLPPDEFRDRYPNELSGGQRQRVGIARALAADPPLVLLDEPFGALDPVTRETVRTEFSKIARQLGKTFVLITHDIVEAVQLGDRVAVMNDGRVAQCCPPDELVREPANDFVEAMLGTHRYQLRLMTTRVSAALDRASATAPDEPAIEVSEDADVWTALAALESARAHTVRVVRDGESLYLARRNLIDDGDAS